jgi:hypothetical protein
VLKWQKEFIFPRRYRREGRKKEANPEWKLSTKSCIWGKKKIKIFEDLCKYKN